MKKIIVRRSRGNKIQMAGWKEKISLPGMGIFDLAAKFDTGAKSSALHAEKIRYLYRGDRVFVEFEVPLKKTNPKFKKCLLPLLEERVIKDSSGNKTLRPVITVMLEVGGLTFSVEMTLIGRHKMENEVLVGRDAMKGKFIVHPAKSFLLSKK